MKQIYFVLIILILTIISDAQINHKRKSRYGFEVNSRPTIYYNTFVSHLNKTQLLLNIKLQNDILQFQKSGNHYSGKYEISLNLKVAEDKQTMLSDSWYEDVIINNFKETNSKRIYQESQRVININLEPGKYELNLKVRDAGTGNVYHSTKTIKISDGETETVNYSKIIFIDSKDNLQNEIRVSAFENIVEFNKEPLVYFEIETPVSDSLIIISKLLNLQDASQILPQKKKYHFYANDKYFQFAEQLDKSYLNEGEYRLEYRISYNNNTFTIKDTFEVIWFDKPLYLYKYDLALRPMKYLLTQIEFEKADGLSNEELESWFLSYWKEKDPTPNTPFNALQYEFYSRVHKAILDYSLRFKEGWKTNRGEALILYGEPSKIESHHHVVNRKPFEIWHYQDLNKKLIFVDKNKNGDFKLVNIEQIED